MHELDVMSQHLPHGQPSPFGGSGSDEMHDYEIKRLCFKLLKPYRCEREEIMNLVGNNPVRHPTSGRLVYRAIYFDSAIGSHDIRCSSNTSHGELSKLSKHVEDCLKTSGHVSIETTGTDSFGPLARGRQRAHRRHPAVPAPAQTIMVEG